MYLMELLPWVLQTIYVGRENTSSSDINREIQSWPQSQSQSQSHVTSKLRHVYYPMLKVWSEHEYSVQKLSSSVDFQIMLMSCVQKKVLSTEGIYHWNRADEKARWSPTKRVCMGAWTDTLGKKERHQPLSHKGIVIILVNAKMTDCLHLVIFTLLIMILLVS